jgi:hypothetical protein
MCNGKKKKAQILVIQMVMKLVLMGTLVWVRIAFIRTSVIKKKGDLTCESKITCLT